MSPAAESQPVQHQQHFDDYHNANNIITRPAPVATLTNNLTYPTTSQHATCSYTAPPQGQSQFSRNPSLATPKRSTPYDGGVIREHRYYTPDLEKQSPPVQARSFNSASLGSTQWTVSGGSIIPTADEYASHRNHSVSLSAFVSPPFSCHNTLLT